MERLSSRESNVLPLVAAGLSNDEIGARLGVSESTARFHVRSLLRKFNAANRTELAARAVGLGFVASPGTSDTSSEDGAHPADKGGDRRHCQDSRPPPR